MTHVEGKDKGKITLYALSTCIWCKKARLALSKLGVAYDYEYVDLLKDAEREKAMEIVRKWNPAESFPVIVINNSKCIQGYDEEMLKEELG